MLQEKIDTMEYVYAALLLHKLGKDVDEANLSSVVKASGAEVNEAQVKSLVAALADVNIDDAVKAAPVAVAAARTSSRCTSSRWRSKTRKERRAKERRSSHGRFVFTIWIEKLYFFQFNFDLYFYQS